MLENIRAIIPFLEKSLNATVLDYTVEPLTKQGDNFGSTLLAINIKVQFSISEDNLKEVRFSTKNQNPRIKVSNGVKKIIPFLINVSIFFLVGENDKIGR